MRIMLIGYGKMGKTIEAIALERGHEVPFVLDVNNPIDLETLKANPPDAAIEFSQPDAAFDNIKFCIDNNIPVVSGTTGWLEKKNEIDQYCLNNNGAFFYASNYSIGVNIFFKLNEYLAKMMNNYPEYAVDMEEIHHTEKKDAPSGTAITLAEGVIKHHTSIQSWVNDTPNSDALNIKSLRIDKVPGTHTVSYRSDVDDIEIKHTAHSRKGFALGSVLVAEWIADKKGVLGMDDFLSL